MPDGKFSQPAPRHARLALSGKLAYGCGLRSPTQAKQLACSRPFVHFVHSCPGGDSNSQPLRDALLRRTRIPIPPRAQIFTFTKGGALCWMSYAKCWGEDSNLHRLPRLLLRQLRLPISPPQHFMYDLRLPIPACQQAGSPSRYLITTYTKK